MQAHFLMCQIFVLQIINVFFADGTCDKPTHHSCCRAAWAVVQTFSHDPSDPSLDRFVVTQSSHTQGFQSIHRSELESVCWLVDHFSTHMPDEYLHRLEVVEKTLEAISMDILYTSVY